jgi:pilus assembly protein Flp/PilA
MITHNAMFSSFRSLLRDERGQGLVEYALIIALVSIVAIAALKFLGSKASNTLNNAANAL